MRLGLRRRVPSGTKNKDEVREEIRQQLLGSGENLGKKVLDLISLRKKTLIKGEL